MNSPAKNGLGGEEALPLEKPSEDSKLEPPAEQPTSVWTRRLILFAFWAVVVIFGLPHWIWTTSIHRSTLPLESMNNWADGKVSS